MGWYQRRVHGKVHGSLKISDGNAMKLFFLERQMLGRGTVQFVYMNKYEMYSGSKSEIVEKQFIGVEKPTHEETEADFGYISNGKGIPERKRIRDQLYAKFKRPEDMALALKKK